jgi:uncharacterized membrane protein YjgN (DUF898 family)
MAYVPTYTPSDMPNVATDVVGSAGVEFKIWIPLIIFGFVAVGLIGAWVKVRRAGS